MSTDPSNASIPQSDRIAAIMDKTGLDPISLIPTINRPRNARNSPEMMPRKLLKGIYLLVCRTDGDVDKFRECLRTAIEERTGDKDAEAKAKDFFQAWVRKIADDSYWRGFGDGYSRTSEFYGSDA